MKSNRQHCYYRELAKFADTLFSCDLICVKSPLRNNLQPSFRSTSIHNMHVFGISVTQKSILLPVALTFALFIVALGMRPIQLNKINKPRVHNRDIVQDQDKISQTGVDQTIQAVEPSRCVELVKSPSYHVSVFPLKEQNSNAITTLFIPSRAPPASLV